MFGRRTCWCLALVMLLTAAVAAETTQSDVAGLYRDGVSHWSKGASWRLEFSCLPLYRSGPPQRQFLGQGTMTVLETPADGAGHYLIGLVADKKVTKSKLYFVLDPNDLSLLEMRSGRKSDPNDRYMQRLPGHKIAAIPADMARLVFPVCPKPSDGDANDVYYRRDSALASRSIVRDFEDTKALVVGIARRDWEKDDPRRRLNEGKYLCRLLWKRGDPWWTSQTTFPGGSYRVELVRKTEDPAERSRPKATFLSLYNRMKKAKGRGDDIAADEYYHQLVRLGKDAVPYMIERITDGDTDLIPAVSEITGRFHRNATKEKCLQWWQRIEGKL